MHSGILLHGMICVALVFVLFIGPRLYGLGWSEKHKSWKMQNFRADSEPRHSTDFRTIFGIMIG